MARWYATCAPSTSPAGEQVPKSGSARIGPILSATNAQDRADLR
jgi:hypothetical protein